MNAGTYETARHLKIENADFFEDMFNWGQEEIEKHDLPTLSNVKTWTVDFGEGLQIDLKLNTSEDDVWSEAVLFDGEGHQLAYTEPSYSLLGEWELEFDGNKFILIVDRA